MFKGTFWAGTVVFKIACAFLAAVMFWLFFLFAADLFLVIIFFNTKMAHGFHSFLLLIYEGKIRRKEPLSILLEISANAPSFF
ncbi:MULTISPECIES: hypothetical protein [Bacillaceae]|uniref:hypothetical protein n=1 Tax=Bacillaceae TaxID=186817 RepID=UPI000BA5177B|nr:MULTISPECIES: hypothetical protein [Bacillaceae]PAE24936.1 hypothetical protein CHI10_10590 [Bacillus sp. 7894-2]URM32484.1 hypothetical protein LLY41_19385 [Cytobacillus firmus]